MSELSAEVKAELVAVLREEVAKVVAEILAEDPELLERLRGSKEAPNDAND